MTVAAPALARGDAEQRSPLALAALLLLPIAIVNAIGYETSSVSNVISRLISVVRISIWI